MKPQAIIDLGTNTFQLLIGEVDETKGRLKILENVHRAVQLGMGAMETIEIQFDAQQRALKTLAEFKQLASEYLVPPNEISCLGTSILRRAKNTVEFTQKVHETLGLNIKIISGLEEADYIYQGILHSLPSKWCQRSLVMDIGGGSVEFILFEGQEVEFKISLELGGLRLLSMFGREGTFDQDRVAALEAYIVSELKPLLTVCLKNPPIILLGAAGAFETIWDLENAELAKENLTPSAPLNLSFFYEQKKLVESLTAEQRKNMKGMRAFRAGILPLANCLIAMVLGELKIQNLWFSRYSLKEGYWFATQIES